MLQKRLDYGFNGYQVPFIPRAARSSRRRGSVEKKVEGNLLCPIDLLATVAGKLLEGEVSQNTSFEKDQAVNNEDVVMEEQHDEVNPLKVEHCSSILQPDDSFNPASVIPLLDCLGKADAFNTIDSNNGNNPELCNHSAKVEHCSAVLKEACLPNGLEYVSENGHDISMHSSEDVKFFNRKSPETMGLDSRYKPSLGTNHYSCGALSPPRGNIVKIVTRDDDENSSGCTHPCIVKSTRHPARIGGRKIRKLLASKYHRMAPKVKDGDISDTGFRYIYCIRKTGYRRQRSRRIYPFKKRKVFHYTSLSPEKAINTTASSFGAVGHGVNASSSSITCQSTSFPSKESHVKVRIKSLRVPDLFIEMPETATIGSLKRTVMEALTALLRGGMHVGVFLQGKKIRDDNRTLLQSGIYRNNKVESVDFTLEPNSIQANPLCSADNSLVLSADLPEPVSRCIDEITIYEGTSRPSADDPVTSVGNLIESDHDSAPSPTETSAVKETVYSQALVPLPEGNPQALAVVPAQQRSRRSEMAQRRIRRPFSVAEVEALVQAVEELGTGRWRDVKLRAFDNVKHRTYVDLKDKWKTLVHTARISPQQRRGEPVPQDVLDRVLAAHAYWSQHQAKQQLKQQPEACLLL